LVLIVLSTVSLFPYALFLAAVGAAPVVGRTQKAAPRRSKASFPQGGGVAYPVGDKIRDAVGADGAALLVALQASCQLSVPNKNAVFSIR
jgi:hypothetical protein